MTFTEAQWVAVTSRNRCPVCNHDSWCSIDAADGTVLCMRNESAEAVASGGWLHRGDKPIDLPAPPKRETVAQDWARVATKCQERIRPEAVAKLAADLGVAPTALQELGIGTNGVDWTFPMLGPDGTVLGVRRRTPAGRKLAIKGAKLGLIRRPHPDRSTNLIVCEGESDTAAMLTLGFDAVGLPGVGTCHDYAAAYAIGRDVVVMLDADDAGAKATARLVPMLVRTAKTVRVVRPPDGIKDARAWLNAGARREDIDAAIAASPLEDADTTIPQRGGRSMVDLGERDPGTNKVVLSPRQTLPTARACVRDFHTHADGRTLHWFAGMFMTWRNNRYVELEECAELQQLHEWLHQALRYVWNKETREFDLVEFDANPTTVNAALATLQAHTFLPASTPHGSWLGNQAPPAPAAELLPCRTMTLHIPTGRVLKPTPLLFNTNALEFDYDPKAPFPLRWDEFLHSLFGDDQEQRDLLQQWFGYCLTADTSQQKALLVVGPRRSGKGTLARVLAKLVGAGNVCGPTTGSLAGPFGLQPLLGKTLAIVSDARFTGEGVPTVVERLLCITGEDTITVDRKHMTSVTMRLPTRFVFLTNELPRFNDASTALAGRFMVLKLTQSFYGKEDTRLTEALEAELPGILQWAIDGWKQLRQQRRFTEPETTRTAVADIEDLSSPVSAFVRERCDVGPQFRATANDLYAAWQAWCTADGRTQPSTRQVFCRDLSAAVPGIARRRGSLNTPFYDGIAVRSGGGG